MSNKTNQSLLAIRESADHILGPLSAQATVIEYADFSCPSCLQAQSALKVMGAQFEGQMRLVFRHFPLRELRPQSELAAQAAEAAGAQGKFWLMHDLLFAHSHNLSAKHLHTMAEQLGLDMARYHNDMEGHTYLQRVQEHLSAAHQLGLRSTPTFFVNGELVDVSFGLDRLHTAVHAAISN